MRAGLTSIAVYVVVASLTTTAAPVEAQQLAYSRVDRATVRVFAIRGVNTVSIPSRGGFPRPIAVPEAGHGSGVAIAGEGVVLTAHHVVRGARLLAVQLPGSEGALAARVIYEDQERDFALLSVAGALEDVLPLPEGPVAMRVRQTVHAVGYPLDPSRTSPQSSRGIVSGALEDGTMQLDMDLNPGNSGGPLIDEQEGLLGIVVARGDPNQGVAGIGLAVPVAQIRPAWDTVREEYRGAPRSDEDLATAALVAELVRLGAAGLIGEVLNVLERSEDSGLLQRLSRVANPRASPDLLAIAAAYFWDWAQVILERHGATTSPPHLPPGRERELSWRLMRAAILRCQAAHRRDPSVADRSSFVGYVIRYFGREAPPEEVPASIFPRGWSEAAGQASATSDTGARVEPYRSAEAAREPSTEDQLLRWHLGLGTASFESTSVVFHGALDFVLVDRAGAPFHVSPVAGLHLFAGMRDGNGLTMLGVSLGARVRIGETGLVATAAWSPGVHALAGHDSGWTWLGGIFRLGAVFGGAGIGLAAHLVDAGDAGLVGVIGPYVAWPYD